MGLPKRPEPGERRRPLGMFGKRGIEAERGRRKKEVETKLASKPLRVREERIKMWEIMTRVIEKRGYSGETRARLYDVIEKLTVYGNKKAKFTREEITIANTYDLGKIYDLALLGIESG